MPYYWPELEIRTHIYRHQLGYATEGTRKKGYCQICYPARPELLTPNFGNFWNWLSTVYHAEQYTGFTIAAFRLLVQNYQAPLNIEYLAKLALKLLESISFR